VVLFHAAGGDRCLVGVDVSSVLSCFFIPGSSPASLARAGTGDLGAFYRVCSLRLLPVSALCIAATRCAVTWRVRAGRPAAAAASARAAARVGCPPWLARCGVD
jgi:peptidoglycan/LPS O-acetylase OafA/YrhL